MTRAQSQTSQPQSNAGSAFADLHPLLAADEALAEAVKCLYCYDAPCMRACPTHIDIPGFIRQILHRNPLGAAKTILDANIFGGSCARACPTQVLCEGACVDNTLLKTPVLIGRLQRNACDAADAAQVDFHVAGPDSGKRVAIVGAGPAGLTCAHELRKRGHAVTIFEARDVAGGLNTFGIAAYKITTEFALTEVERVMRIGGIDLRFNSPVDGPALAKLLADYDALYLAIGLGRTAPLGIPGEDLPGVWESLAFIFQTHTKPLAECSVGRHVVVIGGGNTAIDAANAAVRLGAPSVTIAYRRDQTSMPAFAHEYELALTSGVQFEWLAQPIAITGAAGGPLGVRFQRMSLAGSGRAAKLTPIAGADFTLECDMVIKALGQEPLLDFLRAIPNLKLTADGRVAVDPTTGATSVAKLFAGGDCHDHSGEEIVNAVQDGKVAALGIDAMLRDNSRARR